MAIDMIEDNELSALAPMRGGGRFKNEMSSRPSLQRNKNQVRLSQFKSANGYDTSIIESENYSNFSFTPQWNFDKARVTEAGKALIAKFEFDKDKITCDELKAMKLKLQNASDDFNRNYSSYSNSHVQDEVRTWVNIFLRRVTELDDAYAKKECAKLEQQRLDEEARVKTQQAIQEATINAQLGLSQAEQIAASQKSAGMSSSTKFMLIGGVAVVAVVLISILRR